MRRGLVTLLICFALLLTACLGGKKPVSFDATFAAPIEAAATSGTLQLARRQVPWAGDRLTERVAMPPEPEMSAAERDSMTPGLLAASRRLAARDLLREKIKARVDSLEATEPLPGERRGLTLVAFASRHPEVARTISRAIERGIAEQVIVGARPGESALEGSLVLAPVADAVLAAGGGRRITERDLQAAAARAALDAAQRRLYATLLDARTPKGAPVREWVAGSPERDMLLRQLVQTAQIVRSAPMPPENPKEWRIELSVPYARFERTIDPPRRDPATNQILDEPAL